MKASTDRIDRWTRIGLGVGILAYLITLGHAPQAQDFLSFYESGLAWRSGGSAYPGNPVRPNLNPPSAVVFAFAPLSLLSVNAAAALWAGLGVLSILGSLSVIERTLSLSRKRTYRLAAVLTAGFPALCIWFEGQTTWLLLYPMTRAWAAYHEGRSVAAGAWLAPVIAVKPMFVVMPWFLGWSTLVVAGVVSAGVSGLALAITGLAPWRAWLTAGGAVWWLTWPTNASLWGWLARWHGGPADRVTMSELGAERWIAIVLGVLLAVRVWRIRADRDRAWLAAGLLTIIVSPIGWIFFGCWFAGALTSLAPQLSRPRLAVVLLAMSLPVTVLYPWQSAPTWWFALGGSVMGWGVLALCWITSAGCVQADELSPPISATMRADSAPSLICGKSG